MEVGGFVGVGWKVRIRSLPYIYELCEIQSNPHLACDFSFIISTHLYWLIRLDEQQPFPAQQGQKGNSDGELLILCASCEKRGGTLWVGYFSIAKRVT